MFQGITKREFYIIAVAVLLLIGLIITGVYYRAHRKAIPAPEGTEFTLPEVSVEELEQNKYTPEVPKNAVETKPTTEAPTAPNASSKLGTYDVAMSRSGFEPASITVKKGNLATIYITAVDADYDVKIPYMEMWLNIKKGEKKQFSFQTNTPGTFIFECDTQCPPTGKINGTLVVLP